MTSMSWIGTADLEVMRLDCEYYAPAFVAHARFVEAAANSQVLETPTLGNIAALKTGPFGSKLPSHLYRDGGVPLFRVQNVVPFFPKRENLAFLDHATHEQLKASEVLPGDVLISKAGRVGDACLVTGDLGKSNITEHVIAARPDAIDGYLLVAALNTTFCIRQAQRHGLGTLIDYLGVEAARAFRVPIPRDKAAREKIAGKVRRAEELRRAAAAARQEIAATILELYGSVPQGSYEKHSWVAPNVLTERVDSWFYRAEFLRLEEFLRSRDGLVPVGQVSSQVTSRARLASWGEPTFDYLEIGGVDPETGLISATTLRPQDAPSRAQTLVKGGDVLVSTVRPEHQNIAQLGQQVTKAVASSGFAVLRAQSPAVGAFVRAALVLQPATMQLLRWNTGGTYPAIDHDVPLRVLIPDPGPGAMSSLGHRLLVAHAQEEEAGVLLADATRSLDQLAMESAGPGLVAPVIEDVKARDPINDPDREGTYEST